MKWLYGTISLVGWDLKTTDYRLPTYCRPSLIWSLCPYHTSDWRLRQTRHSSDWRILSAPNQSNNGITRRILNRCVRTLSSSKYSTPVHAYDDICQWSVLSLDRRQNHRWNHRWRVGVGDRSRVARHSSCNDQRVVNQLMNNWSLVDWFGGSFIRYVISEHFRCRPIVIWRWQFEKVIWHWADDLYGKYQISRFVHAFALCWLWTQWSTPYFLPMFLRKLWGYC